MSKSHYPTRIDPINLPRRLREGLAEADTLLEQKKVVEAKKLLEELDEKFPRQFDVLGLLADACIDTGDLRGYLGALLELHKLRPNSPDVNLGLAGAYLNNGRMALALRTFERFLERWPGHPTADDARKTAGVLQKGLKKISGELNMGEEEGLAFARKHEELQVCLDIGQFQRGKSLAKELLERKPDFAPALNNLSQVFWLEGDLPGAIETCRKALAIQPDNIHALANIIRFLYLAGRKEETPAYVERLKKSKAEASDRWKKISETLSFIGDDEGMLDLRVRALREGGLEEIDEFFYHFLAVSEVMLGQEGAAKSDWKRALKTNAGLTLAQENLDDLKLPKHERNGPWAHPLGQMLPEKVIREMTSVVARAAKSKNEASFEPTVQRFLNAHPEILQLSPLILERGEPAGKEFVVNVADMSGHPDLLSLLKEYAFGQRGSDSLRLKASQVLTKHGILEPGEVKMWIRGEWTPILMLGFEITEESMGTLKPKALPLAEQAMQALRNNNGLKAEELLRRALQIQPDEPSLLNNLAVAFQIQKRTEEAEALAEEIRKKYPDYSFGQITRARKLVHQDKIEEAGDILNKILSRKKLHITEFSALCNAQIELLIRDDKPEGALTWIEMWEKIAPDHPQLEKWKDTAEMLRVIQKLKTRRAPRARKTTYSKVSKP